MDDAKQRLAHEVREARKGLGLSRKKLDLKRYTL